MTTYRLPAVLGAAECEAASNGGDEPGYPKVGFDLPGVTGQLWLDRGDLTEVKPPLPPEPAELGWYLATIHEYETIARKVEAQDPADGSWSMRQDGGFPSTWRTLNEDFPGITLRRLVPAPPVVELPWLAECASGGSDTTVQVSKPDIDNEVAVVLRGVGTIYLSSTNARAGASALWTAADEAERRTE